MKTKSTASKSISFKMKDAPRRNQPISSDFAHHQMSSQIKGSKKSQEHAEDCGKV
jgi:hypothetical protein